MTTVEKINILREYLTKVDDWSEKFDEEIRRICNRHKIKGGNLEYAYVRHFHTEIRGLSSLFQYLLSDEFNRKYVFFPLRASIEVLLYLEYVFRLAKIDSKEVFSLLSKDMAQSAAAINAALPTPENHLINTTLKKIDLINKLVKTDFELVKSKPRSKVFPRISDLCEESQLSLKDKKGGAIYHIYALYSESNHLRLSSQHSISSDYDTEICWALEYFIEVYIKFYEQILDAEDFPNEFVTNLSEIKHSLGL